LYPAPKSKSHWALNIEGEYGLRTSLEVVLALCFTRT